MSEKSEAKQAPLPDLLDHVPEDIVLGIPGDEPMFSSYTNIPIGRLARQAAAELRRLVAEHEEDQRVIAVWRGRTQRAEAQRDALLKALCELLADAEFLGWDTAEARAAIKMAEEEGWVATAREAQKHFNEELKRYEGEKE